MSSINGSTINSSVFMTEESFLETALAIDYFFLLDIGRKREEKVTDSL